MHSESIGISISDKATIDTAGFNSTLSGVISGVGSIDKINAGRLALAGNNSFDGQLNVQAGRVAINQWQQLRPRQTTKWSLSERHCLRNCRCVDMHSESNGISISEKATIDTAGFNSTLSGVISGIGSIDKINAGRLALAGDNSFDGQLNVQAGRVAINSGNSLGQSDNQPSGP
jgi:autotransporter-associated beta strand protein